MFSFWMILLQRDVVKLKKKELSVNLVKIDENIVYIYEEKKIKI